MIKRDLISGIKELAIDHGKMLFISGPRQVGKTFMAKQIGSTLFKRFAYYNWDTPEFRKIWQLQPTSLIESLDDCLIFDEIHKAKNWKSTLKGIFDANDSHKTIMVTGSAKLETFRRGGDSLLGRYFHFRLHPLTVSEILGKGVGDPQEFIPRLLNNSLENSNEIHTIIKQLMEYSGFPEPYLAQNKRFYHIWHRGREEKLIREDLRDLSRISELSRIETLVSLLPDRVGSLLSLSNLARDMEVTSPTIKNWLNYLKALFYLYEIRPYSTNLSRSIKKEAKIYFWDYSGHVDIGKRNENFLSSHLLKVVQNWTDLGYGHFDLNFLRDKEKREVDFVIVKNKRPWILIECKSNNENFSPSLDYFLNKIPSVSYAISVTQKKGIKKAVGKNKYIFSLDYFLSQLY